MKARTAIPMVACALLLGPLAVAAQDTAGAPAQGTQDSAAQGYAPAEPAPAPDTAAQPTAAPTPAPTAAPVRGPVRTGMSVQRRRRRSSGTLAARRSDARAPLFVRRYGTILLVMNRAEDLNVTVVVNDGTVGPFSPRPETPMGRIQSFFQARMSADSPAPDSRRPDTKLAACALLLELAYADESFTEGERQHLRGAVGRQFGLDPNDADELLELAERARAEATDLWQFTSLVKEHYSTGQKMVLLEIMWGLVSADGQLSGREEYLLRKVIGLLDVHPGYLAEVRRQAHELGRDRGAVD